MLLYQDLDRLEKRANRNLMKFCKGQCEVLHPGSTHLIQWYELGAHWLESSSAEKLSGVLLGTSQQCAFVAKKANSVLSWCSDPTVLDHGKTEAECMPWTSAWELGAPMLCPCAQCLGGLPTRAVSNGGPQGLEGWEWVVSASGVGRSRVGEAPAATQCPGKKVPLP